MAIYYPDEAAVARIGTGLIDRTLPKAEWTHAAHFGATLWILRRRPDILPERDLPAIIRAYNEATGGVNNDSAGYHETITQASLAGARAVVASRPADMMLHALHDSLLASRLGDRDWLLDYWTRERLFSVEARRNWVAPDLRSLPWSINPQSV